MPGSRRSLRVRFFSLPLLWCACACMIHHVQIDGPASTFEDQAREPNPVFIDLSPGALGIADLFRASRRLEGHRGANMELRYRTEEIAKDRGEATSVLWCLTLGVFPMVEITQTRVTYELFDRSENRVVKSYRYFLTDRSAFSWLTIPFSILLSPFFDSIDTTADGKTDAPRQIAFDRFETDLLKDLNEADLGGRFFARRDRAARVFALLPFEGDARFNLPAFGAVETELVKRGLPLVERKRLEAVYREIARSATGLTGDRLEVGRLASADFLLLGEVRAAGGGIELSLKCVETETGSVIWKQAASAQGASPEAAVPEAARRLVSQISK